MLNERSRILLKTLVERYIAEGHPVGSQALSVYSGLALSSATIRNVLADLEALGLVASPHTSAGRVPTRLGYRLFVDSLLTVQPLDSVALQHLERGLTAEEPNRLIAQASQLLSGLSQFAGIVLTPKRSPAFRQIEFLALSERRVLLILVTTDGDVQNRILQTERPYPEAVLHEAAQLLNRHYAGQQLETVRRDLLAELAGLQSDIGRLMQAALDASQAALQPSEACVISGEGNLLQVEDFSSNLDSLRQLFAAFEQKTELLKLLDLSQQAEGVQIFIGGETGALPLEACAAVTAPYSVKGKVIGTLGVIGPTRMAYDRIVPIVDITARLLSSALSHGQEEGGG